MNQPVNYVVESARVFLGLVFLCSVVGKLRGATAFRDFRDAVGRMAPALGPWTSPLAVTVVAGEATVVVTLAVPDAVLVGFGLSAGLLVAFTGGLVGVLHRNVSASCHCFGGRHSRVAPRHVVRNVILLAVCLAATGARLVTPHGGETPSAGLLLAAGLATVLAAITVTLDDLAHLFAPAEARRTR